MFIRLLGYASTGRFSHLERGSLTVEVARRSPEEPPASTSLTSSSKTFLNLITPLVSLLYGNRAATVVDKECLPIYTENGGKWDPGSASMTEKG